MKSLSLFTLILLSTLFMNCSNQAHNKQTANKKIEGFKIPLPENWIDKSELSVKENLSKFNLNDSEISNLLKTHNGSIPVAIYTKYDPSAFNGPIPTIQVILRPNPNKDFSNFKKDMQASMSQMGNYLSNFKIIKALEEIEIDGIKGLVFISQFDLPGYQEEIWTIRSWSYAFPSGKYFYQINFSDTEDENSENIYNKIIEQVKFRE